MKDESKYTIGICCSGNTCRSPITGIWLEQFLNDRGSKNKAIIWTAGIDVPFNEIGVKKVEHIPLIIAKEMNLNKDLYDKLSNHTVKRLSDQNLKTDLLVWITAPDKTSKIDPGQKENRFQLILNKSKSLNATLMIIPENDDAWEARENNESESIVKKKYKNQALRLIEWAKILKNIVNK